MDHHGDVHVIKEAPVHELHLAAHVVDGALLAQLLPERELDHLLGGDGHEADGARETVQSAGLFESGGQTQKGGALALVPAAVGHTVHRLGMVGDVQSVQLPHDTEGGAGPAGLDVGVEAGDVARLYQLIAQTFVLFHKVLVGLPLGVAGLGVGPEPAFGVQYQLPVGFGVLYQLFLSVGHHESSFPLPYRQSGRGSMGAPGHICF